MGKSGKHRKQEPPVVTKNQEPEKPVGIKMNGKTVAMVATVVFGALALIFFLGGHGMAGIVMALIGGGTLFAVKALGSPSSRH